MVEQFLKEVTPTTKTVYTRLGETYKIPSEQGNIDAQPDTLNHYVLPITLEKYGAVIQNRV